MVSLQLVAREILTPERFSSETVVRVMVMDVNDNPPQFANTSYTASVSELATAETPVIKITVISLLSVSFHLNFNFCKTFFHTVIYVFYVCF